MAKANTKNVQKSKASNFKMPHTYVIIFGFIIFSWLLTFIIPVGKFSTTKVEYKDASGKAKTKTVLDSSTFRYQYALDNAKLKTNLDKLINDDAKLKEASLDKTKVKELLAKDTKSWTEKDLEGAGLTEDAIYKLYKDTVYDTSKKATKHLRVWGTEDYKGYGVLNYVFEGMVTGDKWGSAVGIIAFILVIGGAFGIIIRTGAVDAGIWAFISKSKGYEKAALPLLFILFSLGGAVFGMAEETIPFAMIIIPFVIAMGYDSLVGITITYVASQIGNAASWMNPFGVAVAQGIAGVPVLSGATFRIIMWVIFTAIGAAYLMIYGEKIRKNPEKSIAYETDAYFRDKLNADADEKKEFKLGHGLVLLTLLVGMVWVVWGVTEKAFYIPEIASQFFVIGLVSGIIAVIFKLNNMTVNDMASAFSSGAADLVGAALVVGMAKGILMVLGGSASDQFNALNTILHSIGNALEGVPAVISGVFMYAFQTIFNFFVTSNSGQAALTMPILAPLSDIIGMTRQTATLAYQLGSGFADAIVPTSASLLGVLGVARLDWGKWARYQIKMQGVLFIFGAIFMVIAVLINFS